MPKKGLSSAEQYFVCQHVQEGVVAGETDEQLKQRRKWLAERLHQSVPVISATTAHMKIRATGLVGEHMSVGQISQAQCDVYGAGDVDRRARQIDLAFRYGVRPELIEAVTDGVLPSVEDGKEGNGSGEHVDYNQEVKIKWRQKWADFIDKNTDPSERANMKVLCLPGKECLEIPIYLKLGFKPENIVGVEGGDRLARAQFELNAENLGIDGRVQRLEDLLEGDEEFDVISLDFHGQLCESYFDILHRLPLKERTLLMVNTMGKRDTPSAKYNLEWMMKRARKHRQFSIDVQRFFRDRRMDISRQFGLTSLPDDKKDPKQVVTGDITLSKARSGLAAAMSNAGFHNRRNWVNPDLADKMPELNVFDEADGGPFFRKTFSIENTIDDLGRPIAEILDLHNIVNFQDLETLKLIGQVHPMIFSSLFGFKQISDLKKYKYRSQSGSGRTDFYTEMAVMVRPVQEYRGMQRTLQFMINVCSNRIRRTNADKDRNDDFLGIAFRVARKLGKKQAKTRSDVIKIGNKHFEVLQQYDEATTGDYLFAFEQLGDMRYGKYIDNVPIGTFLRDLGKSVEQSRRYKLDLWDNQMEVPREEIV